MATIAEEHWYATATPTINQVETLVIRPGYLSREIVVEQFNLGDVFELEQMD